MSKNAQANTINKICHHSSRRRVTDVGELSPVTLGKGAAASLALVITKSDRQTPNPGTTLSQLAATHDPPLRTREELEQDKQLDGPAAEQLEHASSHF